MTTPRELQSGKLPVRDCCHGLLRAVPKQWHPTTGISLGGLAVHQPSQHVYRLVVVKPSRMRCPPCMLCATHFNHNATTWPSHCEPGIKKGVGPRGLLRKRCCAFHSLRAERALLSVPLPVSVRLQQASRAPVRRSEIWITNLWAPTQMLCKATLPRWAGLACALEP